MDDYKSKPYTPWLEDIIRETFALDPVAIGIISVLPDRKSGTAYWNADNADRLTMLQAMGVDYLIECLRINKSAVLAALRGLDDDESSDEDDEEQ